MDSKTIIILGAGTGGLVTANALRKKLPQKHRIILVDRTKIHAFAPSFLWVMTGKRQPEHISTPVQTLVEPGVEILHEDVHKIDVNLTTVSTRNKELNFDYLVVASGAELAPEMVPGLAENAHTFYSLEGSSKLFKALDSFTGGKIALVICAMPYKCPVAPYEGAMLIQDFLSKKQLSAPFEIHLFTPEPGPLPVAGPELSQSVKQMIEQKGIIYHPKHNLKSVLPESHTLEFDAKETFAYDLLVSIPPHRSSAVVRNSSLANDAGWIPVDRSTLATQFENIYAIGDVTTITIPGRWQENTPLALPKAGVFAHSQAFVVAEQIAGQITGKSTKETFCGDGFCMLEAGDNFAGFAHGNFFAEPAPEVKLHRIGPVWHFGKIVFEKWWLAPLGLWRNSLKLLLKIGAKSVGMPTKF